MNHYFGGFLVMSEFKNEVDNQEYHLPNYNFEDNVTHMHGYMAALILHNSTLDQLTKT